VVNVADLCPAIQFLFIAVPVPAVSFSALAVFSRNALYKSTFYLLTYLLTSQLVSI